MAARTMWKGVIHLGGTQVPIKLYSAVQDQSVHFRLLHAKDHSPVKQAMVNPETNEVVPYSETLRTIPSRYRCAWSTATALRWSDAIFAKRRTVYSKVTS